MRKGSFFGALALLVAIAGVVIALAAYFKHRSKYLYDEDDDFMFDDPDDLEYYTSDLEDDEEEDIPSPPDKDEPLSF